MRKDPTEFRKRFAAWKNGEKVYKDGLPAYRDGKDGGKINYSRWDNAELTSYSVPFIDEKRITLTNAGRATGAVLSTNLLDSIADNANRAGLPLLTALGLAVKETTLGNPTDDRTAWNLSSGIRQALNNKYPGTELHINYWGDALNEREDVINYHKGHLSDDPNSNRKSVLLEAFEFYKQHPDKYNPGQKNYSLLVDKRGTEVMGSPEVLKWLKERNLKKATGRFNRINPLLNESKFNLPRFATGTEGGYKYSWNSDTQSWDRYTADLMGEVFNDLVITPPSNRRRFDYEKQPTVLHSPKAETDSQYTQRRIREELNRRTWRSDIADAISLVTGFTPAGNVELGLNAAAATARGNYGEAAVLGAGILLPGMFRSAYKAAKAIKPITKKALRYSPEEELLANEAWKETMDNEGWYNKWARDQFEDNLPLIHEVEDVSKQVIDKAGSPDFYPALEDALSYPMEKVFGKNTMRREITRDILPRLGYPAVSRNQDLLLDGKPLSEFIPWQIKSGEKYDPLAYDVSRVYKSSVENALPYLVDAIPELTESQAKDILEHIPWAKSYLAQNGAIQKSGKPFLTYLPDSWDGSTNIIELMHPSRVKRNIKWLVPRLDAQQKGELMKQYSLFKKIHPSEQTKYTTDDGATILIDPESKTSAAYFNPETALRDAQNDFDRLFPGESWALVDNGALSADSYTLLEALTRRHSNSGTIHIPRKPDGTVSMQRLNTMGKYRTIEHVKKAVSNLRKSTGVDLPDPYEQGGHIYAPNFYWTKNL